ncbi:MAG: hypothetical protein KAI47_28280, partial [Deltaproteobacteria bacterium]|nr:hypothetical protein [Deltaproteobacteria bacterium]
ATSLGVDLLFLGRVKENGDTFQLALYAYDKAAGRVVGHAKGTVRVLMVEDDIDKVLDGVFAAIKVTRMPPTPKPQGPGFFARMVGSKWFWPVVGVVAGAAAIAGATVGIVAATQSDHRRRNAILLPAFSYR